MRNTAVNKLTEMAESDSSIVILDGDLGFGVLDGFTEKYPSRSINPGISEQNMMGMAAGLALCGKTPYVYSIGNFPGMRCIEQIRNDVCYHNLNVNILAVGGGFPYGQLGMSHHATEDLAVMRALPNMRVYAPADAEDVVKVVEEVNTIQGPCYIRLGRGREPVFETVGKRRADVNLIRKGEDVAIVTIGPILNEAVAAAEKLAEEGIDCTVISLVCLKPFPSERFFELLGEHSAIVTVEEHNVVGGLGSTVADEMVARGCCRRLIKMGLKDCYTSVVGDQAYLRKFYGISAEDIERTVRELVPKN